MDKPGLDESTAVAITGKIMVIAIIVLFLVVMFVLFLHLYAKWFWWRIEEPTSHPSRRNRRRRFVFAPGHDTAHPLRATKGLDSTILASLPVLMFRQEEFKEGLECAVCLCDLVEGEKARMLPKCNHGFHVDCIDMWFQSHSTCPLCRNPIFALELEIPSHVMSGDEVHGQVQSPDDGSGSGYSTDSPIFPTNVLFWGNHTQVSSGGGACLEEGASASASYASSTMASSSVRQEGMLVIDVPMNVNENFPEDESSKSPMPTRLRSLKRLLSREKKVAPNSSSSSSVDV